MNMHFHIITIFPKIFDSYINESIIKMAREKNKIDITVHDLRDYTKDKHRSVDDTPFGGGAGMILKIEPIFEALKNIKSSLDSDPHVILMSAKGHRYNQQKAHDLKGKKDIVLICGRYEGVDYRIQENLVDETISIGNYVVTGGELPALVVIDSVSRLIPGVLGNEESIEDESFTQGTNIEYPQYTRPAEFQGWKVPKILMSGNHERISQWRNKNIKKYP